MEIEKLDNPAWHSLNETHQKFAIDYNNIKFYQPQYCPFGGFINLDNNDINQYASLTKIFFVIGDKPIFGDEVILNKELICDQMIIDNPISLEITEPITTLTSLKEKTDLFDLVNLVQPGYFMKNTADLGDYFGIYKNDKLVAVTGERMKMNNYTEISAVVTHPDHTGKGYAKQLTAFTCNKIFSENKKPYLHVVETNIGAIKLYEKLGFRIRRKMSFWNFSSINN